jgi:hypothetical protein
VIDSLLDRMQIRYVCAPGVDRFYRIEARRRRSGGGDGQGTLVSARRRIPADLVEQHEAAIGRLTPLRTWPVPDRLAVVWA